ncbi:Alpha/Beta hydrolase protein [Boletus reticuloceps]|uniref:Alpha/Beta hydrolase protein n=1 Tax=Boletus reticuloceps TaxID=495285 RepID=A0A8I2YJK0_9AGAM|nr:Alpha/Beta hydrolase protein [Boletus reticuloceps]
MKTLDWKPTALSRFIERCVRLPRSLTFSDLTPPTHWAKVKVAPYGTWDSPISSASAVAETIVISYVFVDRITHQVYHFEQRPAERGRSVIVHSRSSANLFERGSSWNARSAVHEYGGGAAVAHDGIIYFSHVDDGRLYKFSVAVQDHVNVRAELPTPVTPMDDRKRYASPTPHPTQQHVLVAILEDHTHDTPSMVINSLVCIDTLTSAVYPLITGADFYAAPTFSPDGTKLAWQAWNHPHMPWVGTTIWVADITFPSPSTGPPMQAMDHIRVTTSVAPQPPHPGSGVSYVSWLDDDRLLFLAETSGWRNPWVYRLSLRNANPALKAPILEDFASVYKSLGSSYYAPLNFSGPDHDRSPQGSRNGTKEMLFVAYRGGRSVLYVVDLAHQGRGEAIELECPFVDVSCVRAMGRPTEKDSAQVVFIASSTDSPSMVTFCSISRLQTGYHASFSSAKAPVEVLSMCLSLPRPMTLTDSDGEPLHIVYYAPSNPAFVAPYGESPPCVVNVHGGPTLVALQSLDWMKQWYTSRGWAWLDVNYRGSSLYGRQYTDHLDGRWGVLDVLDCVRAAHVLSSPPYSLVDPARCVIRGLSAGGYTVLSYAAGSYRPGDAPSPVQTDTAFSFRAGASHFGIADLTALARASHKFESHYVFKLLGGRPDEPKMADVYRRRSPVFHADSITMPLLMLQGLADRVVPPEQSQAMVDAIVSHGGSDRVKYKTYEGEGHGFSRADTNRSALEEEATWFAQWLGIKIRL